MLNIFTLKNQGFLGYLLLTFRKQKEHKMLRRSRILWDGAVGNFPVSLFGGKLIDSHITENAMY